MKPPPFDPGAALALTNATTSHKNTYIATPLLTFCFASRGRTYWNLLSYRRLTEAPWNPPQSEVGWPFQSGVASH